MSDLMLRPETNFFKRLRMRFSSYDTFTKTALVVLFVIVLLTPFIAFTKQNFFEQAATGTVVITSVAVNNSSALITFQPVPGAKDYRVYDINNPNDVKYAGMVHINTDNGQQFAMQADGVTPLYPFVGLQGTTATSTIHIDVPSNQIEWNELGDHKPHTLVVEAVDAVGPPPLENMYVIDANNPDSLVPQHQTANTMLGMNAGNSTDGKYSTNGQGNPSSNPQVLAQSTPFTVTADGSYKPIPSGQDATQTFLDTFDDSETNNFKLISKGTGSNTAANTDYINYTLNQGLPNAWNILFEATDLTWSHPFIANSHYMDIIYDEHASGAWATMAMVPQQNADISNGKLLHMTMEVDRDFDYVSRRWVGFDLAPATDPITNYKEIEYGNGGQPNVSDQALFVNLYRTKIDTNDYVGPTSSTNTAPIKNEIGPLFGAKWPWETSTILNGAAALDKRSRYDLFATQQHLAIFENGSLIQQFDIPNGGLPFTSISPSFSHYYYHTGAEIPEESANSPWQTYFLNVFPFSDERHWDNMGYEVLPASNVPANNDFTSLSSRVLPPLDPKNQCPQTFSCSDVDFTPITAGGSQTVDNSGWTLRSESYFYPTLDSGDGFRFVYQPTQNVNISARVTSVLGTAWGSQEGGVMARSAMQWQAPMYGAFVTGGGTIHVQYRPTQGGTLTDHNTGINGASAPYVKVTSSGSTFSAYSSTNGTTWTLIPSSTQTIAMGSTVLQGVANLSGANNDLIGEATFDNVMINGQAVVIPTGTPTPTMSMNMTPSPSPTGTVQTNQVSIIDFAFSPANITVPVGTTVTWTNTSATVPHTVTSNPAGTFGSGTLNPGQTFQYTFNTVGTFNYICTIHPGMTGSVAVVPAGTTPTVTPSVTPIPPTPTRTPTPLPPTPTKTPTPILPTATPTPTAVVGDANGDGHVDLTDLSILASQWQKTGAGLTADFNHDGTVDLTDFSMLASHWGQ